MPKKLEAIILADRNAKSLWPLTEHMPPCLLPMAGKPLIIHALEALAASSTANVTVVVAIDDEATPAALAEVNYPALDVEVTRLPKPFVEVDTLALRGDIVVSPREIEDLIMQFEDGAGFASAGSAIGAWRLAPGASVPTWRQTATLAGEADRTLPDLSAYWRMCMDVGNSDFAEIRPAGWIASDGIRVGMNARIQTRRAAGPGVSVGADAFVDKNVMLGEGAIIGDRAYVSKGARVVRSVVMPDTFVGVNVMLENAIACGPWLFHADDRTTERVSDQTTLARLAA
jgi:NDP-sugar pyrophosphorylase family protein